MPGLTSAVGVGEQENMMSAFKSEDGVGGDTGNVG